MTDTKEKAPTVAGLEEARRKLRSHLHRKPSPELVKIIEEVTDIYEESVEKKGPKKPGIAAQDQEQHHPKGDRDLDL